MADKPKFHKTALKGQRDALAKYQKFLPILLLKKMQLQLVIRQLEPVLEAKRRELEENFASVRPWARLLSEPTVEIEDYLQIEQVRTKKDNIAGVEVPVSRPWWSPGGRGNGIPPSLPGRESHRL